MKNHGQGTIEYLLIVGIIVVISLIVVSIVIQSSDSANSTLNTSSNISSNIGSGRISIVEAVTDSEGNTLITFQSNSPDPLTITSIDTGDAESNFENTLILGNNPTIYLTDVNIDCPCTSGVKSISCEYKITFIQNDLTTTIPITKETQCVEEIIPTNLDLVIGLGSGTLENPWIINSCQELQDMNQRLDGNYALGGNIDCSQTASWNNWEGFIPIGVWDSYTQENRVPFTGNFNGNNHTIFGLTENSPTGVGMGLFSYSTGTISNVGLLNISIHGSESVGGLIGVNSGTINNAHTTGGIGGVYDVVGGLVGGNNGTINNSYSTANIFGGTGQTGGLVGFSQGTINNSYATGNIENAGLVGGGLVGLSLNGATIFDSYATGNITGESYIGGLVGSALDITNSYATGNVIAEDEYSYAGGLAGYSSGDITNSYATGSVTGENFVGGLVGAFGEWDSSKTISNSYATGEITDRYGGLISAGGLVGNLEGGTITNSYATGNITPQNIGYHLGGLVGSMLNSGKVINSYSTGNITTQSGTNVGGLVGDYHAESITNSYSTGNINLSDEAVFVGGLAGYHTQGTITNSYSTGNLNVEGAYTLYTGGFLGSTQQPSTAIINCGWWNLAGPTYAIANPQRNITYSETNKSAFYAINHNVYDTNQPNWTFGLDKNWITQDNNFPILSWQNN